MRKITRRDELIKKYSGGRYTPKGAFIKAHIEVYDSTKEEAEKVYEKRCIDHRAINWKMW